MRLFTIGDPHLSFGSSKPMDIFKGWQNNVTRREQYWNKVVTAEDTTVICGDLSGVLHLDEAKPHLAAISPSGSVVVRRS